jgi:ATP-dependent Lon protease
VLIPEENVKDLQDIPENAKNKLEIVPVRWIDQVLEVALESMPQPLPEDDAVPPPTAATGDAVKPAATAAADGLPH